MILYYDIILSLQMQVFRAAHTSPAVRSRKLRVLAASAGTDRARSGLRGRHRSRTAAQGIVQGREGNAQGAGRLAERTSLEHQLPGLLQGVGVQLGRPAVLPAGCADPGVDPLQQLLALHLGHGRKHGQPEFPDRGAGVEAFGQRAVDDTS